MSDDWKQSIRPAIRFSGIIVLILSMLTGAGTLIASPSAPLETAVIVAAADATIADKKPSTRFGNEKTLQVGYDVVLGSTQTLVFFELSDGLPNGAMIEDAFVELYVASASPAFDPPLSTDLHRIDGPWNESIVTWSNRPALGSLIATSTLGRDPNFYSWNVTNLVRDWADGNRANHGIQLISDASALSVRSRTLYSREADFSLFRPRLVIQFTVDQTAPNASVDPLPFYSPKSFTVSWNGTDTGGSGIDYFDVQYRANGGAWQDWQKQTEAQSAQFQGQAGVFYEFRARAVDNAGNKQSFGNAQTGTYAGVATAEVLDFSQAVTNNVNFQVNWVGDTHGGAPITGYSIYVSFNSGPFVLVPYMNKINANSAIYTAEQGDGRYAFQATATNADGVEEPLAGLIEALILVDSQPPFIEIRQWLPLTFR